MDAGTIIKRLLEQLLEWLLKQLLDRFEVAPPQHALHSRAVDHPHDVLGV